VPQELAFERKSSINRLPNLISFSAEDTQSLPISGGVIFLILALGNASHGCLGNHIVN